MGMHKHLADTTEARFIALKTGKNKKDNPPSYGNILTASTGGRVDIIYGKYDTGRNLVITCEGASTFATSVKDGLVHTLRLMNSHYIQELNFRIVDKVFPAEYRKYFNIPVISGAVPAQDSEEAVELLSNTIIAGEPQMIAAGGTAISYPTKLDLINTLTLLKAKREIHEAAQLATRDAKKALNLLNVEADAVIKKIAAEVETHFNEESIESMHIDARDWGVVYVSTDTPQIITANVMHQVAAALVAIVGVKALIIVTDESALTGNEGELSLKTKATGTPVLRLSKVGFKDKDIIVDLTTAKGLDLGIVVMEAIA